MQTDTQPAAKEVIQRILTFKKDLLKEYLSKCTEEQIAFFKKLYPNGPSEGQLISAIQQAARTAYKNERDGRTMPVKIISKCSFCGKAIKPRQACTTCGLASCDSEECYQKLKEGYLKASRRRESRNTEYTRWTSLKK